MKFGCNFSTELVEILERDSSFCDYIKIGAFGETLPYLDQAYSLKPLLIHGFGWYERGGMASIETMDFKYMNSLLEKYKSPHLGMHILAYSEDVKLKGIKNNLREKELSIYEHMEYIFKGIGEQLHVPLILENMDYSPFYTYKTTHTQTVVPEYIKRLVEACGVGFLFDLSHAKVSAHQLGMNIYEYIEALPLEKMKEIHFSGSFYTKSEGFKDIHGIMNEDDYGVARFLASHNRIVMSKSLNIITLEYGTIGDSQTSKEAIIEQMEKLKAIFLKD